MQIYKHSFTLLHFLFVAMYVYRFPIWWSSVKTKFLSVRTITEALWKSTNNGLHVSRATMTSKVCVSIMYASVWGCVHLLRLRQVNTKRIQMIQDKEEGYLQCLTKCPFCKRDATIPVWSLTTSGAKRKNTPGCLNEVCNEKRRRTSEAFDANKKARADLVQAEKLATFAPVVKCVNCGCNPPDTSCSVHKHFKLASIVLQGGTCTACNLSKDESVRCRNCKCVDKACARPCDTCVKRNIKGAFAGQVITTDFDPTFPARLGKKPACIRSVAFPWVWLLGWRWELVVLCES